MTKSSSTSVKQDAISLSFFQKTSKKLVLSALKKMNKAYLKLTIETGEVIHIGELTASVKASATIHHPDFYTQVLLSSHIGFSEAFMNKNWDTEDIESFISWAITNINDSPVLEGSENHNKLFNVMGMFNKLAHLLRHNSIQNSKKNIKEHYDLNNAFFALFLDPTMTYSSAKFIDKTETLEQAQLNKYESLCQKLRLKPTDHLLEIGTGWGGFSMYAAEKHGCQIDTVTISEEQFAYSVEKIKNAGLSHKINVQLCDYRHIEGQFDKLVSIEMIEAVGDKYLDTYMKKCASLIKPNGIIAIQMITCPDSRYELLKNNVDFIQKHIFPGSLLPSVGRINKALNKTTELSLFELEDMGLSYAKTLRLWDAAFSEHMDEIKELGFNETFIRKWHYYFFYCAAAFQMRNISVVQAVYTFPNNLTLNP